MSEERIIAPNLWVVIVFGGPWMEYISAAVILAWTMVVIVKNNLKQRQPSGHSLRVRLEGKTAVAEANGGRDG